MMNIQDTIRFINNSKPYRIELEYGDYSKCMCIVLAKTNADITALARGWMYEYQTAKKVSAYEGLTDNPIVCYVREDNCINIS